MTSVAQTKATTKYIKEHTKTYVFRCNNESDADLISWLDSKSNRAGYIKDLIRQDMQKNI